MGNEGLSVLACCGDFEYGGNAEISPSMIHNEIVNPTNKKRWSYVLEQQHEPFRFLIIFPFVLLNQ